MTDPLTGLVPDFADRLNGLLVDLAKGAFQLINTAKKDEKPAWVLDPKLGGHASIIMRPIFGVRDCITQAKLWCQSRPVANIYREVVLLHHQEAPYLAECIAKAPHNAVIGKWATNAIPGESWHQWGEAEDCAWIVNGKICWDEVTKTEDPGYPTNGYNVYMAAAANYGLTAIGKTMGKDFGHVQLRAEGSPKDLYSITDINKAMEAKFGGVS